MTSEPDPRTDLAGWLGLKPAQVSRCRSEAEAGDGTVAAAVGRRLIAQDQADTPDPEPDEGCAACGGTGRSPIHAEAIGMPKCFACNGTGKAYDKRNPEPDEGLIVVTVLTSLLDALPDLTEQDCKNASWSYSYHPGTLMVQIGRALKAADWTPEGEA